MRPFDRRSAPALVLGALLSAGGSAASAQLLGPEFQVNEWTTYGQGEPSVAADGAGEFVVAWESYKQGNDGCYGYAGTGCFSVYARRFDEFGHPLGGELQVNVSTQTTQKSPSVSRDAAGDFVVAWDTDVFYFGPGNIRVRRFDPQGAPLSGDLTANTHFGVDQFNADVSMSPGGEFVVVWEQTDLVESSIYGRLFDASGTPLGTDFQIQAPTTVIAAGPRVVVADGGAFTVVWQRSGGIWGQRYDENGVPQGGGFPISQGGSTSRAAIARQGAGGFVVAWNRRTGNYNDILARRFDAAGVPLGDQLQVDTTTTGDELRPAVAVDGNGDFLVAWEATDDDGSATGVFARRLDPAGTPSSGVFLVNEYTTGAQRRPAVAATPGGDFLVAWESVGQDGSGEGVFGRLVRFPLFADDFETGDTSRWSSTQG